MSAMDFVNFNSDGTENLGDSSTDVNLRNGDGRLFVMIAGDFGGGTLNFQRYSESREAFVTVATYSEVTTDGDELKIGRANVRVELTGSTGPDLNVDYWWE